MLAPLMAAVFFIGLLIVPFIHSAATGTADIPLFEPGQYTAAELTTSTLNDGIPDVWKVYYRLSTSDPAVANSDYNGSGIMNREKYQLNIHPLASADPPEPVTPIKNVAKSAKSTAQAAPNSSPPSVANGNFTGGVNIGNSTTSGGFANASFKWSYNTKVDGWNALVGKQIEVWRDASGVQFVELNASGTSRGIEQKIASAKKGTSKAGTYVLSWRDLCRNQNQAGDGAYKVHVFAKPADSDGSLGGVPVTTSPKPETYVYKPLKQSSYKQVKDWPQQFLVFTLTEEMLKNNPDVWIAFEPLSSATYGAFIAEVSLTPVEIKVANSDDLKKKWADATNANGQPVYSGKTTGDMVCWKINLPDASTSTFTWRAEGPESITGPSGTGINEWKIADGGNDPQQNQSLTWKPGTYTMSCTISSSGGGTSAATFQQKIGWRTEDYLVIGQIIATNTHDADAPGWFESISFRYAIINDVLGWLGTYMGTVSLSLPIIEALVIAPAPNSAFGMVEFAAYGATPHGVTHQGPFDSSWPAGIGTVTDGHRFWMMQNALNGSVDSPTAPGQIAATALDKTVSDGKFRILHHYQFRFSLTPDGKIDQATLKTLANVAAIGKTKLNIPAGTIDLGFWSNPTWTVLSLDPERNSKNGSEQLSADLSQRSGYASGRIGSDGQNVNWRMFGRDVPWIFSEIMCQVNSDHAVEQSVKTSVDITWKDGSGVVAGQHPFNNLNIYKATVHEKQNGFREISYDRDYLLPMNGQVEPFVNSVPYGTWPTPPTKLSVK